MCVYGPFNALTSSVDELSHCLISTAVWLVHRPGLSVPFADLPRRWIGDAELVASQEATVCPMAPMPPVTNVLLKGLLSDTAKTFLLLCLLFEECLR